MRTSKTIQKAVHLVAKTYYGDDGQWLCQMFDAINSRLFSNSLPQPLITIEMTKWGRCPSWCRLQEDRPPHIIIHPVLFGGGDTDQKPPWGLKRAWLGKQLVFDVLLHECVHLSMEHNLGGYDGPTSHNNDQWISEVNRICPLIGLKGIEAGRQVPKRVPEKGRAGTVVKKVDEGNVPFKAVAAFPYGIRVHRKTASKFYRRGRLPVR